MIRVLGPGEKNEECLDDEGEECFDDEVGECFDDEDEVRLADIALELGDQDE
ncbi:MAG: hypothetical protein UY23_C0001G0370 [Candidatus Jorgensenbacteria bacterium GW2011_GWA1_48_11]|uniref:Uncharacterized protein n=1 Tax=Candidatus Jorgensenbacteria bacterium GW2011_GWA1_48_11 TaxID=1618660 RepID=A0A0G1UCC3_9BACT|nr:MAG: hypothetical protein UY23_C0001G0370 [Candidatus Jorgensenbacteria bacterium GW2011_GWA1_48_11]KKW12255.1 MAG: hypothetical protein UY51_C0005G0497 [Candidatus Jorgensenbacteria bacterium GW2011_GWB1_49_9]